MKKPVLVQLCHFQEGGEAKLQIGNCLQQEPDRVRDGKDPSRNAQTHLSQASHYRFK